jgi:hypothetical protein
MYFSYAYKQALAPTNTTLGIISMVVYALFLIPGFLGRITIYRILMVVAILVIGWGGVVTHIINIFTQPQVYMSIWAWAFALGINLFGLVLNFIAALGLFKR